MGAHLRSVGSRSSYLKVIRGRVICIFYYLRFLNRHEIIILKSYLSVLIFGVEKEVVFQDETIQKLKNAGNRDYCHA